MSTRQDQRPSDHADISRLYQVLRSIADRIHAPLDPCRWIHLYHQLSDVLLRQVSGEVVQLGCREGHTPVFLQKILDSFGSVRRLHVYDAFEEPSAATNEPPGESVQAVLENFVEAGLQRPQLHAGRFSQTLPRRLPEAIAFTHLDLAAQEAVRVGLLHVYPRLSVGAVVVVEDYTKGETLRVAQACEAFLADKPERMHRVFGSAQGTFRKLATATTPSPCVPIEQTLQQLDHLIGDLL